MNAKLALAIADRIRPDRGIFRADEAALHGMAQLAYRSLARSYAFCGIGNDRRRRIVARGFRVSRRQSREDEIVAFDPGGVATETSFVLSLVDRPTIDEATKTPASG